MSWKSYRYFSISDIKRFLEKIFLLGARLFYYVIIRYSLKSCKLKLDYYKSF